MLVPLKVILFVLVSLKIIFFVPVSLKNILVILLVSLLIYDGPTALRHLRHREAHVPGVGDTFGGVDVTVEFSHPNCLVPLVIRTEHVSGGLSLACLC